MPKQFIPGLRLSELFYTEAVRPILNKHLPNIPYAAARIGTGSEILGYDDPMSTDHDWGPSLNLFLRPQDHKTYAQRLLNLLAHKLPHTFLGYSVNFSQPNAADNDTQTPAPIQSGPINHRVTVQTIQQFADNQLNFDLAQAISPLDWLTFSQQQLLEITRGRVYHDAIQLNIMRARFAYYPHDVWLYMLAAGWRRIAQEEHLMGRTGVVRDEGGSSLIGSRLVRDIMRLCFLLEKKYTPYPKWIGTAFAQLECAPTFGPILQKLIVARGWQAREKHFVHAATILAKWHNALNVTPKLPTEAVQFHNRPFQVVAFHGFAEALVKQISDPLMQQVAAHTLIGGIDQFSDSTDLVTSPHLRPALKQLYLPPA